MIRSLYGSDHLAFRNSVREFVTRALVPIEAEMIEAHQIPRDVWLEAGKQGLLGLNVPEQYGGSAAGDYRFNAVLMEELASFGAAVASSLSVHFDVVAPYLCDLTTSEQRERWLPQFCSGELITAIALTEPGGGSDLAALRTSATRDGSDWIVNGAKTFITNGTAADLVILAARTDANERAKGISLFAIESGMQGFTHGAKLDKVGQPEADTAELFFDMVRVPQTNQIGELNQGFKHVMRGLAQERLGAAIASAAHAESVLAETLVWVRDRQAFGQSIGSFQYNKFVLADLVTKLEATRAYVDAGIVEHVAGRLTAVDAAKLKLWASEVQNQVIDACVQLWGGYGYMREYRVSRAWMDARVSRIWAGTNEIMREVIGRDLDL